MTSEEILLAAQAQGRANAISDRENNPVSGGIWMTAPIGDVDRNYVDAQLLTKQALLISGTNIKSVNGVSILGSGDMTVAGGGTPGATGPAGPAGPTGPAGATGAGVLIGGTVNQALTKINATNYNTEWSTIDKTWVGLGNVTNDAQLKIASNLADLASVATARTNLGLVSGGTGDIWVLRAGDTMTGNLSFSGSQKLIGGSSTTADLTLQTTTGVGATGADMHFLVGNNGTTEAMTILNNGTVGVGTTSPTQKLDVYGGAISLSTVAAPGAPIGALSGTAGNVDNGLHYYAVTYVNAAGETTLGTAAGVTVVDNTTSGQVNLTGIPTAATSANVTARKIYRTTAGAANLFYNYKLVATINDNTTTTYTDNATDASLTGGHSGNNTAGGYLTNGATKFGFAGASNTYFGQNSLLSNTTGYYNTAYGVNSLRFNTTGYYNTANGTNSLYANTTGYLNTANGYAALFNNTTGYFNTANGTYALYANTTGYFNTASGYRPLFSNTTGYFNTANGTYALYANTTGYYNTANGTYVLYANTTGNYNTANGYAALYANTTGAQNTALGYSAGRINTTGSNNTYIGTNAGYTGSTDGLTNATAIGYNTQVTASNSLILGNGANVGIGTTAPNANALLDVTSTTKAFMPPRTTTTQKNAIASPTAGMVVYDSTLAKLAVYTGTAWEAVTSL